MTQHNQTAIYRAQVLRAANFVITVMVFGGVALALVSVMNGRYLLAASWLALSGLNFWVLRMKL